MEGERATRTSIGVITVGVACESLASLVAQTRNTSFATFLRTINPVTPSCGLSQLLAVIAIGAAAAVVLEVAGAVCKAV